MIFRIVITGAPGSGKTEILNRLKKLPDFSDFVFFDELARRLLIENPDYRKNWSDFHVEIYRRQVARENNLGDRSFVTDRGTADAFAFHPETMSRVATSLEKEYRRYTTVMQLGSAATLGEEFYQRDDIRDESDPLALTIERAITEVWRRHPHYHFVKAEPDFERKFRSCVDILTRLMSHP